MADTPKTNKERLAEITAGIEQGIEELFQSDRYAQYLAVMSRFHRYSVNNTMLIYMQKPDATLVAGFGKWRDQFERHVKKGEKGIQIIAPTPFKKKVEMEKIDPDTQAPVLNADGTVVIEEKEIQIPMYKPVFVFDVGQTQGKPLPTLASDLTGNVARYDFFMEALRRASLVPMAFETMRSSTDGYFSGDSQRIAIREGMSEVQTVSAAIHEITHSKLHNYEQERLAAPVKEGAEPPKPKDRNTEEVEAESVSYAVCQYYGIQTGENSFGYIAAWSKDKDLPELRASLETINKTASGLISDIDHHFRAVVKEYDAVIEAFAADYDTYVRDHSELVISSREEVIADTVRDIKSGDSRFARNRLNQLQAEGAPAPDELLLRLDGIEKNYPPREIQVVHLLDNETYLHIQESDAGFDYTLYDKRLREIDGGYIDTLDMSLTVAYDTVLTNHDLTPETSEKVSLDILDEIRAVREADIEQYKREHTIGRSAFGGAVDEETRMDDTLFSPRTNDLIATYEELFVVDEKDRVTRWFGDSGLHVPKDGVTREEHYQVYQSALHALGNSHDLFLEDERYIYRGNMVVDMCRRNNLPIPDYIVEQMPPEERAVYEEYNATMMSEIARWKADHITDFTVSEQTVIPPNQSAEPAEAPEQVYSYPMPDPDFSVEDLEACGYMDGDMLPLSQQRALALYSRDLTIYMIDDGGEARMAFDSEEIVEHGGLFAVPCDEWALVKNELAPARDEVAKSFDEQTFFDTSGDAYAIFQVKQGEPYRDYRFEPYARLQSAGLAVDRDNYNFICAAPLTGTSGTPQRLEAIYHQFNVNHPADFRGHSLSVSDIVALKQNGNVTYHYCDSMGFVALPGFDSGKNPLRSVEDMVEQNDNQLDGIINNVQTPTVAELEAQVKAGQSISLMDLARATHAENNRRPSILENLRRKQQEMEQSANKNKAQKKSAEMEL